jgi:hypothetical protein
VFHEVLLAVTWSLIRTPTLDHTRMQISARVLCRAGRDPHLTDRLRRALCACGLVQCATCVWDCDIDGWNRP